MTNDTFDWENTTTLDAYLEVLKDEENQDLIKLGLDHSTGLELLGDFLTGKREVANEGDDTRIASLLMATETALFSEPKKFIDRYGTEAIMENPMLRMNLALRQAICELANDNRLEFLKRLGKTLEDAPVVETHVVDDMSAIERIKEMYGDRLEHIHDSDGLAIYGVRKE